MNSIKTSVVITVYNVEPYIEECLNSVINQTQEEIEIICIDDASEDASADIISKVANNDERIKYVRNEKNLGLASSMNVGIRHATGKYIYFLDGDDYLDCTALDRLYTEAERIHADVITFGGIAFNEDGTELKEKLKYEYVRKNDYGDCKKGIQLFAELISNGDKHGNTVFLYLNRGFMTDNQLFFPEGIGYGVDSPLKIYGKANIAKCISDNFYMRRYRKESMVTMEKKKYQLQSITIQFIEDIAYWKENNWDDFQNKAVERFMLGRLRTIVDLSERAIESEDLSVWKNATACKFLLDYLIQNPEKLFCNLIDDNTMEKLRKLNKIYIYGAGKVGKKTETYLRGQGVDNIEFVVSRKITNSTESYVRCIDELEKIEENEIILVAVARHAQQEIITVLREHNIENYLVVCDY